MGSGIEVERMIRRRVLGPVARSIVGGCSMLFAGAGSVFAQATGPATQPAAALDRPAIPSRPDVSPGLSAPIIVTASRIEERPLDVPYSVDVVGQQQIQDKQYRSAPEALQEVPGVLVQRTASGQGSPFIRGFTGFRTLLLIDGIRLNNSTFRDGPNQYFNTIDPYSVDRFEVVKGPSSVLYGSDAIGGTVNAITKTPHGYGEGFRHEVALYQRGSSAERSYTVHPEAIVTFGQQFGAYVAGSYKEYGDIEGGRDIGRQHNTGYDEWSADFKLEYLLAPNQRLIFAHQELQQNNAARAHSTIQGISFEGSTIGTDLLRDLDQYRDLTYVQYRADRLDGFVNSVHASLSWQSQFEREDRIRGSGATTMQEFDVGTLGVSLQLTSRTPIGELTYGIEYYRDNVSSRSSSNPIQGVVADDANYDLLGIYLQDRIPLTDRFDLTLGGRFTYARAESDGAQDPVTGQQVSVEDDWTSVVGSIRANYFIVPDRWAVYGGVSQGFRAPNLSDLTRFDIARSNELQIPALNLDPEEYVSYEIGVKAGYENLSFQLAYFYTQINNMIVGRPTGAVIDGDFVVSRANAGDGYVHGVELGLSWRFHPDFTFFTSASWQDGEVDQFPTSAPVKERQPLSRLIPTTGIFGVRWDDPSRRFFVEGVLHLADEQNRLTTSDMADTQRIPPGGTPEYELVHLRGAWRVNENARLTLAIENIFDEDYRVHGSGVNGAGRNFILGLELRY
jgi:hemoglobin/transferrin/lactoferrin receptor protein